MTIERAIEIVKGMSMETHTPPIKISARAVCDSTYDGIEIEIDPGRLRDGRDGTLTTIKGKQRVAGIVLGNLISEDVLVDVVSRQIVDFITHEVEEHLRYNGRRVFNPHPEIEGYNDK